MKSNILIIDAYNVMHAGPYFKKLITIDLTQAREELIDTIRAYCSSRKRTCYIVFDGQNAQKRHYANITVIYSHRNQTADDVIVNLLSRTPHPKGAIVVTSDRELRKRTLRYGCKLWDATYFLNKIIKDKGRSLADEGSIKEGPPSASEIEYWLKQFGEQ